MKKILFFVCFILLIAGCGKKEVINNVSCKKYRVGNNTTYVEEIEMKFINYEVKESNGRFVYDVSKFNTEERTKLASSRICDNKELHDDLTITKCNENLDKDEYIVKFDFNITYEIKNKDDMNNYIKELEKQAWNCEKK